VAPWADTIKRTAEYGWTSPLHYIDAEDGPPHDCSVNLKRDCPDGKCVVVAISNFSSILADESNDLHDRVDALKFITHFIGDVHQPLHGK